MAIKTLDISVVVANYNTAHFLHDFFSSILASTIYPKELIMIDDGSSDNSIEIIRSFLHHNFIHLIDPGEHIGFANALNLGLTASSCKYIARVDSDDILMPQRLERQYDFLETHPEIDVLGGNVIYFHCETGHDIIISNFLPGHHQIAAAYRSADHGIQHPTVMVRSDVYRQYQYRQETYPAEDYDVFARMIRDGRRFANLAEAVNRMRIHKGSVSSNVCYNTIDKTFTLRDEIFEVKSGPFARRRYFRYILYYRRFLYARNFLLKIIYILLASAFYPEKVWLRIKRKSGMQIRG